MPLDVFLARWLSILWLAFGLSHLLQPRLWIALLWPLRERETGGLIIASVNFPLGLVLVIGHNVWEWGLPVIVTIAAWLTTIKSAVYLFYPRALAKVMSAQAHPEKGMRAAGIVMIILGALTAYDAFFRR